MKDLNAVSSVPSLRKRRMFFTALLLCLLVGGAFLAGIALRKETTAIGGPSVASVPAVAGAKSDTPVEAGGTGNFVALSKKIVPSVVNISTLSVPKGAMGRGQPNDLFRRFFEDFFNNGGRGGPGGEQDDEDRGGGSSRGKPRAMALGTGFIIDSSGLILTNNHVVADADEIKIHFTEETDEKPTDGEVVGRDPELDLALIKVTSKRQMVPVALGDSDAMEVGEYVIAVGNPFGQGHSVTHGIISAKERQAPNILGNYLQTDAPINPGNSGGPLVNMRGEVIGINNAIDQRAQGIGFAIPINLVKKVLPQLREKGTVSRGYIGVVINHLSPEVAKQLGLSEDKQAPIITQVNPGEPADRAGVKPYDVVLEFAGKPMRGPQDFVVGVTSVPVGESASLKVWREGKEKTLSVKVAEKPSGPKLVKAGPRLKEKTDAKRSRVNVGMELSELTPELAKELGLEKKRHGVVVMEIGFDSPADRAGLMRGDLIVEVNRKDVKNLDSFSDLIQDKKSNLLRVRRVDQNGKDVYSVLVLDLQ